MQAVQWHPEEDDEQPIEPNELEFAALRRQKADLLFQLRPLPSPGPEPLEMVSRRESFDRTVPRSPIHLHPAGE